MSEYTLFSKIETLNLIEEAKAKLLAKELNIKTLYDILYFFPFRYEDRSYIAKIDQLDNIDFNVNVRGKITSTNMVGFGKKSRFVATLKDENAEVKLIWFKGHNWINRLIKPGMDIIIFGKPEKFMNQTNFVHPEIITKSNISNMSSILPVYKSTESLNKRYLNSKAIAKLMKNVFKFIEEKKIKIHENLNSEILAKEKLFDRKKALKEVHFPTNFENLKVALRTLKFEELFYFQFRMLMQKNEFKKKIGYKIDSNVALDKNIQSILPFKFTSAQKQVLEEIRQDLFSGYQMNRLLQGDVGSGKTIVAINTCLLIVNSGYQALILAPTEILAEQHYKVFETYFKDLDIKIAILTGSTKTRLRREISSGIETGYIKILFGTHALLEDNVQFKNLGIAVIDEQHRFGVAQRAKLWEKNSLSPHILVMTATPIPRTLAMTAYGDLDVSTIDELPLGRIPIKTAWMRDTGRLKINGFIQKQINEGRQVYIVYPLIEESKVLNYKYLEDGYESIKRAFPNIPIGVLHGRMDANDKDFEMEEFRKGKTKILVATVVIEVGIDVPNATVMIIESAERFGLSQLHQLRGRVGRGQHQSYCILVSGNQLTTEAKERLSAMVKTTNGFEIADFDLKLRGPGDLLGIRQSGMFQFRLAKLIEDKYIVSMTRQIAKEILNSDPTLSKNKIIKEYLDSLSNQKVDMAGIS